MGMSSVASIKKLFNLFSLNFFLFWVLDSEMSCNGKSFDQGFLHDAELFKSELALVKLPIVGLFFDKLLDHLGKGLFADFVQRAGSRFNGIEQHDDGGFFGMRFGTRIAEKFFIDFVPLRLHVFYLFVIEIIDKGCAVVFPDDVDEALRQAVFTSQGFSFWNVGDDHLGRLERGEQLVNIESAKLVFGEVVGVKEFSDIVIKGSHAAE